MTLFFVAFIHAFKRNVLKATAAGGLSSKEGSNTYGAKPASATTRYRIQYPVAARQLLHGGYCLKRGITAPNA